MDEELMTITELHAAALKEFEGDEEATRALNEKYKEIESRIISTIEELRALKRST